MRVRVRVRVRGRHPERGGAGVAPSDLNRPPLGEHLERGAHPTTQLKYGRASLDRRAHLPRGVEHNLGELRFAQVRPGLSKAKGARV